MTQVSGGMVVLSTTTRAKGVDETDDRTRKSAGTGPGSFEVDGIRALDLTETEKCVRCSGHDPQHELEASSVGCDERMPGLAAVPGRESPR